MPRPTLKVSRLRTVATVVMKPAHLRRTGVTALIVGSWLTIVNLGDLLLHGVLTLHLLMKIALNYATPFIVANIGLLSRARSDDRPHPS